MLKTILFILYVSVIPLVPLWGAWHFKKLGNENKAVVCRILFAVQSLVSAGCIITYLSEA